MKIRNLLTTVILMAGLVLFFAPEATAKKTEKIRFLIYTDLHHDLMPGGPDRLREIVRAGEKNRVDFMIDLGDLVFPYETNRVITDILDSTAIPQYHVMGNHDMDVSDKQTYMDFVGIEAPYYTFDRGIFRFVVLDSNFFTDESGNEHAFDKANYFSAKGERDIISGEQLEWLEHLLTDTSKIYVLFYHAPNADRLQPILKAARDKGVRIATSFIGHMHSDDYQQIDGVNYVRVNSASYLWGGEEFQSRDHYPAEVYEKYPSLQYIVPYEKTLCALVDLSADGTIRIKGVKGKFKKPVPAPDKLAAKPYRTSPSIENRTIKF